MRKFGWLLISILIMTTLACSTLSLPGGQEDPPATESLPATEAVPTERSQPTVPTETVLPSELDVQWGAIAYASTEYGNPDWSAGQATGAPDTAECGDYATAWAASGSNSPDDWLEVHYAKPMFAEEIRIYETYNPGSIVRVEVITVVADYIAVWEGDPEASGECPRVFSVPVEGIEAPITGVRLTLDQSVIGDWNEIDAVQLVGYFAPEG